MSRLVLLTLGEKAFVPAREIDLANAHVYDTRAKPGDRVHVHVGIPGFAREAAQVAKRVILEILKLAEIQIIDHLVYASPDLDRGIDAIELLLGVRAVHGGSHPKWGTRNALLALGPDVYLEIIAPDPELPRPELGFPFRIDALEEPALVTWAMKSVNIDVVSERAREEGYDPGLPVDGSRALPNGGTLRWRSTLPQLEFGGGLIPFLIDWRDSQHPAETLPSGGTLIGLSGKHPNPARVTSALAALGIRIPVTHGGQPQLIAMIETSRGVVRL